jgi:hypothetical protein
MSDWTQDCYVRLLIDNHITEDDPSFMTRFDPQRYVSLVKRAGIEASMVYACDHNGNCYYPTRVGHMHRNLQGRDIFGETVSGLHREGIVPVAYYTSIYHNHSAQDHPAWRMQDASGKQHGGRYWWSCPNHPEYAAFTRAQVAEVIAYDVAGIFIDMTFWPVVCCCASCREKYRRQTGKEIPQWVDWGDRDWVAFQRFREASMVTFCQDLAAAIKEQKDITVTFQNSPIIFGWAWGQTPGIAQACDYTSGDFYGGKYQHVLGAKILSAASQNQPFEYMTSRCVDLTDHTSMKSTPELRCEAATTLASGGAYFFIDAINPDGTLMEAVYNRLGEVTTSLTPFTRRVRAHHPTLAADLGLYFSMLSFIDPAANGQPLRDLPEAFSSTSTPAYQEMSGASIALTRTHRLFRVVRAPDGGLDGLKTLLIPNAQVMSSSEVEQVREFVRAGGTLIATGLTSLTRPDGSSSGDFALADVFGVSYTGAFTARVNYLAFPGGQDYVSCNRPAPLVRLAGAQTLAELAVPLFDPDDPERYASIHSNPPGRLTGHPGLTINPYGNGHCIYLAPPLLALRQDAQQAFAARLLQEYAPPILLTNTDAPAAVEITLLRSSAAKAYLVCLVNYQGELPNVPVQAIQVELRLEAGAPQACTCVSNGQALPFQFEAGLLRFTVPHLETIEMIEVVLA